jgi:hypothetical protein
MEMKETTAQGQSRLQIEQAQAILFPLVHLLHVQHTRPYCRRALQKQDFLLLNPFDLKTQCFKYGAIYKPVNVFSFWVNDRKGKSLFSILSKKSNGKFHENVPHFNFAAGE